MLVVGRRRESCGGASKPGASLINRISENPGVRGRSDAESDCSPGSFVGQPFVLYVQLRASTIQHAAV